MGLLPGGVIYFQLEESGGALQGEEISEQVSEGRNGTGQKHGRQKGDNNEQRHRDCRMKIRSGDPTVWCGATGAIS